MLYSEREGEDYGQRCNTFDGRLCWAARCPLHLDSFVLAAASQPDTLGRLNRTRVRGPAMSLFFVLTLCLRFSRRVTVGAWLNDLTHGPRRLS